MVVGVKGSTEHPGASANPDTNEHEGLDEHVQEYLRDMAKPGARTAWAGLFPRSFAKLLSPFDISAEAAFELALKIRSIIMGGMDEIRRERNAEQHQPKETHRRHPLRTTTRTLLTTSCELERG